MTISVNGIEISDTAVAAESERHGHAPDPRKTAIEALPPQYRITVLLADVEGFSYNDIAEITNVKKGTVMSRLFRGRRLLQKALVDQARSAGFAGGKQP